MNFVGRWEVAKQLLGGCTYSAGGKFYECLNAFVRVAKRTFRSKSEGLALRVVCVMRIWVSPIIGQECLVHRGKSV